MDRDSPKLDDLYGIGAEDAAAADTLLYAQGDPCPECGRPMDYDAGEPMTRNDPGSEACIYCDDCGGSYPVDHKRMVSPNV